MDLLTYFKAEIETVGRQWKETIATLDEVAARRRPRNNVNHALWLTGHMIWAEDYLLIEIPSGKTFRSKEWDVCFDHSSEKLSDDEYPPWGEVRAEFTIVHEKAMKHLARLNPIDLHRPSVLERQWFPSAAHSIAHQVTHGHYHLGQLMYLTRLLAPSVITSSLESLLKAGAR
ncbi:MAG TPA: DinB family protein [Planctomycetota bacterium]|nr:DinB family protein [Planctomycetota bacterium]